MDLSEKLPCQSPFGIGKAFMLQGFSMKGSLPMQIEQTVGGRIGLSGCVRERQVSATCHMF